MTKYRDFSDNIRDSDTNSANQNRTAQTPKDTMCIPMCYFNAILHDEPMKKINGECIIL